jgi:hypothetical protein
VAARSIEAGSSFDRIFLSRFARRQKKAIILDRLAHEPHEFGVFVFSHILTGAWT